MPTKQPATSLDIYLRLLKSLKPYWFIFAFGIFATILASFTDAGIAWTVKPLIDKGLVARDAAFLSWLPFFIIIIFSFRALTNFTSTYFMNRVGRSVVMDYRQQIFFHLLHLPASFYDKQASGKLLSLIIYNADQVASAVTDALLTVINEGFLAIGLIIVMFITSWRLTLFFMATAPLVAIITHVMSRRLRKISSNVQQTVGNVTHVAREGIDGYKVIRTFGGEKYETAKFDKAAKANRHQELKAVVTNGLGTSAVQLSVALPIIVIACFMHTRALSISVGSFGAIIVALLRLLTPLRRLAKINTNIQKGIAGAQSIFEILDETPEQDVGSEKFTKVSGKIEYNNVSFHYPRSQKLVLSNISFLAQPGQVIAWVGHSGAGKSTLAGLLPRFYETVAGEILIDDKNIRDIRLTNLRQQIAFVSQNITLFNDTIAHNIAYGRLATVKEDDIVKAAEAAYVMEFVKQLPDGLNTPVGENGLSLSGGQRQRIAIARAILKDAPILILDEATSALDTKSERYVQAALEKLMQQRTTLVIAHRLSTVEKADQIIVLEEGKIVERGTHAELLKKNQQYTKLYHMQFSEPAEL